MGAVEATEVPGLTQLLDGACLLLCLLSESAVTESGRYGYTQSGPPTEKAGRPSWHPIPTVHLPLPSSASSYSGLSLGICQSAALSWVLLGCDREHCGSGEEGAPSVCDDSRLRNTADLALEVYKEKYVSV